MILYIYNRNLLLDTAYGNVFIGCNLHKYIYRFKFLCSYILFVRNVYLSKEEIEEKSKYTKRNKWEILIIYKRIIDSRGFMSEFKCIIHFIILFLVIRVMSVFNNVISKVVMSPSRFHPHGVLSHVYALHRLITFIFYSRYQ